MFKLCTTTLKKQCQYKINFDCKMANNGIKKMYVKFKCKTTNKKKSLFKTTN